MSSVVSSNPHFAGAPADSGAPSGGRWKKVLAVFGAVAVSVGVGVAIGRASVGDSASDGGSSGGTGGAVTPVAQAQATMEAAVNDPDNVAITGQLNATVIDDLLTRYEADPEAWDDRYVTAEIMEALRTLRDEEQGGTTERRALRTVSTAEFDADMERQLDFFDEEQPLVGITWRRIRANDWSSDDTETEGNDQVSVQEVSGNCMVLARGSNDAEDWLDNLDLGNDDVLSIRNYNERHDSCPCERTTWWWCSLRSVCSRPRVLGKGFDGFIKPYNDLRANVWTRLSSCIESNPNGRVILGGYSRGGGVIGGFLLAILKENLVPASKILVATFGSPRVLSKSDSDYVHLRTEQYRLVYRQDLVPSVPYGWMGYRHFGSHRGRELSYDEGRDRPNFALSFGGISDHINGYDTWFP